ncbi:MAG: MFS transporter [Acidimicrobiales bacterium]
MSGFRLHRNPRHLYLAHGFVQGVSLGAYALAAAVWWVVDLELSPLRLVLLGTIMELVVLASESPTGVVADVFSRKWSIIIAWLIMGVSQMLSPISESLIVLLGWQALFGFGYTFQSGADTAWVTDETGSEDDSLVMSRAIAMALGVVVGVSIAMGLTQWSLRGTMVISGVIGLVFAGFLAATMTEDNFEPIDRSQRSTSDALIDTWRRGLAAVWQRRVLRIVVVATFIIAMVDETVDRLDFPRMRELGFPDLDGADSAVLFGAIWIAMTLLALPVMVIVGRRIDRSSDRLSAMLMTGFLAIGTLGVAFMAGTIFALAVLGWVLRDVIREVVDPVGEAWVNRHADSEIRATVISFRSQSMAFGEISGGLALGLVAEFVGLQAAFAAGAILLGIATLQIGRLLFDPDQRDANSSRSTAGSA